jgi:hypothetical protein
MTRWNPWQALRERTHIRFKLDRLPDGLGAVYGRRGERAAIIIDSRLDQTERRAALAHELIHDERGPAPIDVPASWRPVLVKEESAVNREVAMRLVPLDTLAIYVGSLAEMGRGVTALEVAAEFDVPEEIATRALLTLRDWT